jgi:hypothetical protein
VPFAPEYITYVLNENFEDAKTLFLSPLMAIHHAHLVMLADRGIVSAKDAHAIRVALDGISPDRLRDLKYDGSCEDLFFYIERLIADACGEDAAGRLHTARSRNDIDMTMYRMRQREFILGLLGASLELRRSLLDVADSIGRRFSQSTPTLALANDSGALCSPSSAARGCRDSRPRMAGRIAVRSACAITSTGFPIDRVLTSGCWDFSPTGIRTAAHRPSTTCSKHVCVSAARRSRPLRRTCCCGAPPNSATYASAITSSSRAASCAEAQSGRHRHTRAIASKALGRQAILGRPQHALRRHRRHRRRSAAARVVDVSRRRSRGKLVAAAMTTAESTQHVRGRARRRVDDADGARRYAVRDNVPFRTAHQIAGKLIAARRVDAA